MQIDMRSRIESKFIPEPNSGCFIWTGMLNGAGYGMVAVTTNGVKRLRRAHRLYYEIEKGPIPEGLVIDHLCRMRCCLNPAHMEPVTSVENVMRGESFFAQQVRRTHCPQGHLYGGKNLRISAKGERICKICDRNRAMSYHWKNRAQCNAKRAARAKKKRLAQQHGR